MVIFVSRLQSPLEVFSQDGQYSTAIPTQIISLRLSRIMRRTGQLYTLTLVSSFLTIFASTLVCLWGPDTSAFHLWLDLFPQGFGMASFITSTLIVSTFYPVRERCSQRWKPLNRPWSLVFIERTWRLLQEVSSIGQIFLMHRFIVTSYLPIPYDWSSARR